MGFHLGKFPPELDSMVGSGSQDQWKTNNIYAKYKQRLNLSEFDM